MSINVGTAIAYLEMDMSSFKNSIASAGADLKNFASEGGLQNVTNAMNSVGSELTKKVTLPIAGIGAAAANASMDFEAQMSKVNAISGATGEEMSKLKDQAIQLGADTNFSASGAAEGMELFASSGFKVNDIMKAMPGILDTAAAGGVTIAQAVDVAASSLNGFGMSADQVGHIGDVLAKLAGDTNAEILDTGEAMKYIAPVSKALGVSFEDTAASIGLLSNSGIKGTQAGTVLRGALTNLAKPTDTAAALMDNLGMKFFDANGKMLPMTDILTVLRDKTADLTQQEKAAAFAQIFGKEAMSGMLAMVDQGPDKFDELSKSLTNCDGSSKKMAGTMQDNLKGSIEAMKGSIETAAIKIGDVLAPMIRSCATWIADLVNKFSALPKPMQEFIVKVALVAAAIGPVLIIVAKLIESVRTVMSVFNGLKTAASVFSMLPAIINPPVLIIIGIIALIAAIVYVVIKNWDSLKVYFQAFFDFCKNLFNKLWEFFKWVFGGIADLAESIGNTIGSMITKIGEFFKNGIEGWKAIWTDLISFFKGVGGWIVDGLVGGLEKGWDKIFEVCGKIVRGIKSVFTNDSDGLGIHSPSRVFNEYGMNIGDGLVGGVDKKEELITSRFANLATKIRGLGNVEPNFDGLNNTDLAGAGSGSKTMLSALGGNSKQMSYSPNITMHVSIADTGEKGTAQLTDEVKSMGKAAFKNTIVDEFMSDALRL
ncbi:hypothetical protein psyc5s11_30010 [Clostridium gelidum]|uniref:Phage tail tape measure protein domain-containing protein n=1 Tax=Clostridium gelidum TaxID=704125 RepID=A0ABN6J2S8_9CLOT|nr:phage tail tape measure protein [Clostridium gelidum]BCZ46934.1 hypothetical protein psyc5s11_30010 [Clostridium gelidum]